MAKLLLNKMKNSLRYLKKIQWSMGNGQCPECEGLKPYLFGYLSRKSHGHEKNCLVAKALEELGQHVRYKQEYKCSRRGRDSSLYVDSALDGAMFNALVKINSKLNEKTNT